MLVSINVDFRNCDKNDVLWKDYNITLKIDQNITLADVVN